MYNLNSFLPFLIASLLIFFFSNRSSNGEKRKRIETFVLNLTNGMNGKRHDDSGLKNTRMKNLSSVVGKSNEICISNT